MSDQTSTASAEAPAKAVYLADYQRPAYTTEQTELHFDIRDGKTTVSSTLHVRRQDEAANAIELMGEELTLCLLPWTGECCPLTSMNCRRDR